MFGEVVVSAEDSALFMTASDAKQKKQMKLVLIPDLKTHFKTGLKVLLRLPKWSNNLSDDRV